MKHMWEIQKILVIQSVCFSIRVFPAYKVHDTKKLRNRWEKMLRSMEIVSDMYHIFKMRKDDKIDENGTRYITVVSVPHIY